MRLQRNQIIAWNLFSERMTNRIEQRSSFRSIAKSKNWFSSAKKSGKVFHEENPVRDCFSVWRSGRVVVLARTALLTALLQVEKKPNFLTIHDWLRERMVWQMERMVWCWKGWSCKWKGWSGWCRGWSAKFLCPPYSVCLLAFNNTWDLAAVRTLVTGCC